MVSFYRSRAIVLAFFFLIGLGWISYQMETAPEPFEKYKAPAFSVKSLKGETVSYRENKGPVFIVFARPQATPEQIDLDVKALNYAKEREAQCFLVGSPVDPELDQLDFAIRTLDPQGEMAKKFPGQGDSLDWVVIDTIGQVRWAGPRNATELKYRLTATM